MATPLATSVQTSTGTWATFPMGRLDEAANTFWQLFFQPHGASSWSNQVEATATATNGGLVLSSSSASLVVGVRPSADLKFTPVVATSNAGRSWSQGLIDAELATRPDALTEATRQQGLALVNNPGGAEVLASGDKSLSSWSRLTSQTALAHTGAGRSCRLSALTAVGFAGDRPLVGGDCERPGKVGLFTQAGPGWSLALVALPAALADGTSEVLSLGVTGTGAGAPTGTAALVAVRAAGAAHLVLTWPGTAGRWLTSPSFLLQPGAEVVSYGSAGDGRMFVLVMLTSGSEQLVVVGARSGWQVLPSPPRGTETVAFAASMVSAFVPNTTKLTIWSLGTGRRSWAKRQSAQVALQFGSSP